jgi:hypothetical protein
MNYLLKGIGLMNKKLLAIASVVLLLPLQSNAMTYINLSTLSNWFSSLNFYVGAYQGYGYVSDMEHNDGQGAMGRLAFGVDVFRCKPLTIALELGLQNGRTMRHEPAANDPYAQFDLPIQTTLNPVDDLLLSFRIPFPCSFYGILKGGIAFRQVQFYNDDYVDSLNQVSGEFQAGVGYDLTSRTRLVLYYQGIYADGGTSYTQHSNGKVTVSNIPTQQAAFLGFEILL